MAAAATPIGENVFNVIFRRGRFAEEEERTYRAARDMVTFLEIEQVKDEKAGNLSGGQKKLLELGRALDAEAEDHPARRDRRGYQPHIAR